MRSKAADLESAASFEDLLVRLNSALSVEIAGGVFTAVAALPCILVIRRIMAFTARGPPARRLPNL